MTNDTDTTDNGQNAKVDYSGTLFLPKSAFAMRANLPKREPDFLARWHQIALNDKIRARSKGREKYILHDGPPYANGHLHIGHALNKILKDFVVRSRQMAGYDTIYIPGWDCHGLPIEWMVEKRYRSRGQDRNNVSLGQFRQECREYAAHWVQVQMEEFVRLGIGGDWDRRYTTMAFEAEATIAAELLKFTGHSLLYRESRPVMWSVVEKTVLAEAEIEYKEYQSDAIWVKFPVVGNGDLNRKTYVAIWTTTPWTIPANRAICFSPDIDYGLYQVKSAPEGNWVGVGEKLLLADSLASQVMELAKVQQFQRVRTIKTAELEELCAHHPLRTMGYNFTVPLLVGGHVTEDDGTGFVHTAPSHGREDFDVWAANKALLQARGISLVIPDTVDGDGAMTDEAPGFDGAKVITSSGAKGDANPRVIEALIDNRALIARRRIVHQYPHSWRSKKPIIFRTVPQWFIALDRPFTLPSDRDNEEADRDNGVGRSLRQRALVAIDDTKFIPPSGRNRLHSMVRDRPDWVISRQRAWGVPITVFYYQGADRARRNEVLNDERVNNRIIEAFKRHGGDCWFDEGAKEQFLAGDYNPDDWCKVDDILDVWFESGSSHAFVLEKYPDLRWPADLYIEGSDQHRGWFQASLLESCATRARAPYDMVITHGFTIGEDGHKLSKSHGNAMIKLDDVINRFGADILRLWVASSDYTSDLKIAPEILNTAIEAYRKMRNSVRWMLGSLGHYNANDPNNAKDPSIANQQVADLPELERYMLHLLYTRSEEIAQSYRRFDFKRVLATALNFINLDLSAFYFDIRKDALYCDPYSSARRWAALYTIDKIFNATVKWLAPFLPFTCEEAWLVRYGDLSGEVSVHLELFDHPSNKWLDERLGQKWQKVRKLRLVITGALEIERRKKSLGSSLEACPRVYIADQELAKIARDVELSDVAITSSIAWGQGEPPAEAFTLEDIPGVAVVIERAKGRKCARSWRVLDEVGTDLEYPDLSLRDAQAMREFKRRATADKVIK